MSHDRDEGGARALPPRSAQIAQKWSELRDLAEFAPLLRKSYSRAAKNGVRHFQDRRLSSNLGDLSQLVQERALDDRAESSHLLVRGGPQRRRVREKRRWKRAARRRLSTCQRNRGRFRRIPRGGSGRTSHGVPRLPARCSGPARGPAPARLLLGHGGPPLLPRSRCATRKRSLGVAFPARSARAARVPRTAAFDRLLMAAIIPPCRAPRALAAGFQTLPQGRLRKPSAHHPDGLARYALRRTNRRSYGLPVAMILPCARRRGRANRSLRLAPAG